LIDWLVGGSVGQSIDQIDWLIVVQVDQIVPIEWLICNDCRACTCHTV